MKFRPVVFLVVAVSLILSACQPAPSNSGNISFMVFGDPAELAAYQKLVDSFKQKNPAIQVELIQIPGQSDYRKRLAADIAAGKPADVVLINYRRFATFANAGALEPLGDRLQNSTQIKEADFYPQAIQSFKWKGEQTCIPQNISSLVVYYNKDLFDQAGVAYPANGWTWDDFTAAAQALTKDSNSDGETDQFGAGVAPELIRLATFVWQAGGEVVDDESNPQMLTLGTAEALHAADFFFGLQTKYHVVPNLEQETSQDSESRFINGQLAMFFNSRRGVPTYRESAAFDWDVAPLPQDKEQATILHSDGYCITSASKDKDAAWAFLEYANSPEGQTIVAESGRTVPSLISVANSPAFLDPKSKPASSQVFLDMIPYIRVFPIHPNWAEVEETADKEISLGFYGQVPYYEAMARAVNFTVESFTGE
ncbi:MAG: sugar ABC transporter substrate-binding protein [Chloroflexi bacterium]|nr:sugar ABC transporter substrate-binding protein [Chloroflexota bacterium]